MAEIVCFGTVWGFVLPTPFSSESQSGKKVAAAAAAAKPSFNGAFVHWFFASLHLFTK